MRVTTPTATETMLPWKREEEDTSAPLQQSEFPAWASNKEYLAYNSPSATFLGTKPPFLCPPNHFFNRFVIYRWLGKSSFQRYRTISKGKSGFWSDNEQYRIDTTKRTSRLGRQEYDGVDDGRWQRFWSVGGAAKVTKSPTIGVHVEHDRYSSTAAATPNARTTSPEQTRLHVRAKRVCW